MAFSLNASVCYSAILSAYILKVIFRNNLLQYFCYNLLRKYIFSNISNKNNNSQLLSR